MENSEYVKSINIGELNQMIKDLNIFKTYKKNQNIACKTYCDKNKGKKNTQEEPEFFLKNNFNKLFTFVST